VAQALQQAQSVRKVAVKFAAQRALDGFVYNNGHSLVVDMEQEIGNLQSFQGSQVVTYLGRIDGDLNSMTGTLNGEDGFRSRQVEPLGTPGIVMEFIDGDTVSTTRFFGASDKDMDCYAAQMLLVVGRELQEGRLNFDLHDNNAMVISLTGDDRKFKLNDQVTCKLVRMIDLGFFRPIQNLPLAVKFVAQRLFSVIKMTRFPVKSGHDDLYRLAAKLLGRANTHTVRTVLEQSLAIAEDPEVIHVLSKLLQELH
jgi:hypothetical protein